MRCRYAEDRMGWVISHVWHLAGQDIEKTCGDICQKVCSLLVARLSTERLSTNYPGM